MAISSNMSKQWHENRPPQAELFQGQTECQTVTCLKYNQTENPNIPEAPVNINTSKNDHVLGQQRVNQCHQS